MIRVAFVLFACVAGCGDGGAARNDMSISCPATLPGDGSQCSGDSSSSYDCPYGDTVCACSARWYCRSASCPPSSEAARGAACSTPGLSCHYGFEDNCSCLTPENRWNCCGGTGRCSPTLVEGSLCCGGGPPGQPTCRSPCLGGTFQSCTCTGQRLHCTSVACGGDGGV